MELAPGVSAVQLNLQSGTNHRICMAHISASSRLSCHPFYIDHVFYKTASKLLPPRPRYSFISITTSTISNALAAMMLSSGPFLAVILLVLQWSLLAAAQTYTKRVWGVFAYTVHGDNTPGVLVANTGSNRLTDYGASQLQAAGSAFRKRYVSSTGSSLKGSESAIHDLSPIFLNPQDVDVYSTDDQYNIASAQAFMLGLYPPIHQYKENHSASTATGVHYTPPLNGYQFPGVTTLGKRDPTSLIIQGSADCDMHQVAESEYKYSWEAERITRETAAFYADLWRRVLSGVYDESEATYTNAVGISDYLEYEALHNGSIYTSTNQNEISRVRWLADQYTYATNAQGTSLASHSTIGVVNPIAGQTLAASILNAFRSNVKHYGSQQKMTLLFGNNEPAVALASLLGLASQQHSNFYPRPARGASLAFELYSYETDVVDSVYPGVDELFVRFFLHNGTNAFTDFEAYPLFGYGPSHTDIPFTTFQSELETFAMSTTRDWCMRCNSQSVFCTGSFGTSGFSDGKQRMTPAVGGVIGGVVTLVVIGVVATICFLIWGRRKRGREHRPSLGGFKGSSKLASDTDVTLRGRIWDKSQAAEAEQSDGISAGRGWVHGHERTGSWEMGQQRKEGDPIQSTTARPAGDQWPIQRHIVDPWEQAEEEWQLHSGLRPVRIRESV